MRDPVVGPTGVTYDRSALQVHLADHGTYPGLTEAVPMDRVWPDHAMAHRIREPDAPWLDPVSGAPMTHPVAASDGHVYDLSTLRHLFREGSGRSAHTGERLAPYGYRHLAAWHAVQQEPFYADDAVVMLLSTAAEHPDRDPFALPDWEGPESRVEFLGTAIGVWAGVGLGIAGGVVAAALGAAPFALVVMPVTTFLGVVFGTRLFNSA